MCKYTFVSFNFLNLGWHKEQDKNIYFVNLSFSPSSLPLKLSQKLSKIYNSAKREKIDTSFFLNFLLFIFIYIYNIIWDSYY